MLSHKNKMILLILAVIFLFFCSLSALYRHPAPVSFSSEKICSDLSAQDSFSFLKTYCHVHLNGEVEKNTIKNTYISTPSDAIETCLFDPETDITFRPQYYAKDRTGWFFYRNEENNTWKKEKLENFSLKDYLKTVSFSIRGTDLKVVDNWKYAGKSTLCNRKALRFDGTCPIEVFSRDQANLSGLSDGDTSYLSDFSGDIAVSIWTDKTAEKVLQLQYDLSQLKPENGTDIVTVTLLDEIVPFEIPY